MGQSILDSYALVLLPKFLLSLLFQNWAVTIVSQLQLDQQFLDGELVVCGDGFQDTAE